MGDSAGGEICAELGMMARDRGGLMPKRQVLIYPVAYGSYGDDNPYPSVEENGYDYLLTRALMCEYMELYRSSEEDEKIHTLHHFSIMTFQICLIRFWLRWSMIRFVTKVKH